MKKRLFSILLALCMVVCLVPTTAFAESETEETPVCTCEIACTEETMNTECPVCGAEGALAENCGKYAEPAAEGEASQPEGEELQENQDSDMPDTQSEAALAQVSGEGENGIAVQSAGVAIDNTNFPDANFRTFVKNFDTNKVSNQSNSKDMKMLQAGIDSMKVQNDSIGRTYYKEAMASTYKATSNTLSKADTIKIESATLGSYDVDSLFNVATLMQKQKIMSTAVSRAESAASDWSFKGFNISQTENSLRRHMTSWHEKLTLSLACLIFFFIGAPLGGIIRKGGLGMPVVVSVLIFIIYYIINNTGYKMARDGKWIVWMGMWTSTAVLAPLGAFLTYKSNNDSVVLNADAYVNWFKKIAGIRSVRHLFRKEVIIHDPDYVRLPGELQRLSADCRAYAEKKTLMRAPNYFRLWMNDAPHDEEVVALNERLETLIDEMSNTRSIPLLTALNNYPVIAVHAHVRPFRNYWLNMLCGAIVPVGLFFYFRIWAFRIRLNKDMERIIHTNEEIQNIIKVNQNK